MNGIATTTLVGNLTRDIEVRSVPSGASVANFSVAVNKKYKDQSGNLQEKTSFIDCVAWSSTAEYLGKYAKKGQTLAVVGDLEQRTWEDKQGNKRSTTEVVVRQAELLSREEDRPLTQTEVVAETYKDEVPSEVPDTPISLDDIPF